MKRRWKTSYCQSGWVNNFHPPPTGLHSHRFPQMERGGNSVTLTEVSSVIMKCRQKYRGQIRIGEKPDQKHCLRDGFHSWGVSSGLGSCWVMEGVASVVEPFHFGPAPASQDGGSGSSSSSSSNNLLLKKKCWEISLLNLSASFFHRNVRVLCLALSVLYSQ